jgi:UDP-GlcNAc:undecaprenyl-phosphate GlcNAc-1-phosphate transferase
MLIFGTVAALYPQFNVRVLTFDFPTFELGLGTFGLSVFFTTICCVGLVNAVNMADGKNGLVIGLCLGWLAILAFRAPLHLLPLMGLLGAGLVALFLFNLRGRLFLGDGGSYGFGTAIALLTIYIYNMPAGHHGRGITADEIILLFMVPVFDSFRLTFVRMRRGRSPMTADCDHLHHYLQARFGWPSGLVVYLIMALLPAGAYILLRP